jgi:hypothetical protein
VNRSSDRVPTGIGKGWKIKFKVSPHESEVEMSKLISNLIEDNERLYKKAAAYREAFKLALDIMKNFPLSPIAKEKIEEAQEKIRLEIE